MALSVRIGWILWRTASSTVSRNSQAVLRFALSTSSATANLLVRSMATKRGLTFIYAQFGNVDMEIADGISFELLSVGLVAFHIWQSENPMPL